MLLNEKRQNKRGRISLPLSFNNQADTPAEQKEVHKGSTADLSNSGLGIFSDVEIRPGTVIEIECSDIWDTPKKFPVKWCYKMRDNFYRIGLEVSQKLSDKTTLRVIPD
jgi:hypothetical protein